MQTIKITPAFAASLESITAAGKTPWVIIYSDYAGSYAVGAYHSRSDARIAKAKDQLEGKIMTADTVVFEVVDLTTAAQALNDAHTEKKTEEPFDDAADITGYSDHGHIYCPHCNVRLSNGVGVHGDEVNGKPIKHDKFEYACLACGGEFGAAIKAVAPKAKAAPSAPIEQTNQSTIERPCKQVWHIADAMLVTHPGAKRKEILAECVAQGIAFYTARTQYQQWRSVRKEMAEREAKQAAAK